MTTTSALLSTSPSRRQQATPPDRHTVRDLLHRCSQRAAAAFPRGLAQGLTPRQHAILAILQAHAGASQTDLVDATGIDRSTLANVVARMVRKGLLARKRTRRDRRTYEVKLTDKGTRILAEVGKLSRAADTELLQALAPEERVQLRHLLERIALVGPGS